MDTNAPAPQMPPQSNPFQPQTSFGGDTPHKSKVVLVIVLVIVLILLAVGAYVYKGTWMGGESEEAAFQAKQANDNIASIENDLKATDVNNLDKGLGDIGSTLNVPK